MNALIDVGILLRELVMSNTCFQHGTRTVRGDPEPPPF
jgi:hypothetical protein